MWTLSRDLIQRYPDEVLEAFKTATNESAQKSIAFHAKILEALANIRREMQSIKASVEEMKADWTLSKRAAARGVVDAFHTPTREMPWVKDVPEPKEYDGKRDTTVIDFLWHMERYFAALNLEDKSKSKYCFPLLTLLWFGGTGNVLR